MTAAGAPSTTVTVLIATRDRPALLGRALENLLHGTEPPDQLVVVNGGDDRSSEVVARLTSVAADVVLLQCRSRSPAESRNLGLQYCTKDIVAVTDDDAAVAPDWVARIREAHACELDAVGIGGPVCGLHEDRLLSRVADLTMYRETMCWGEGRRPALFLPTVNMSYKRWALEELGCFDPALLTGEDDDLHWRIRRLGRILCDPNIRVKHEHRSTLWGLAQQMYAYGRGYVVVRTKWPAMDASYPRRLQTLPDWLQLASCLCAVLLRPSLLATRIPSVSSRFAALPALVCLHVAWKAGIARQILLSGESQGHHSESGAINIRGKMWRWRNGVLVETRVGSLSGVEASAAPRSRPICSSRAGD